MGITWRFAWRNIWRNPRRTILTMLAIGFGAALLVFSVGFQLGQYDVMISNSVRVFHGLLQVQKEGYLDEPKMRTSIPDIMDLAEKVRAETGLPNVAPRANGFALVSSKERTYGTMVVGVDPRYENLVSTIPGLVKQGRYLRDLDANEVVVGLSLAKNMQIKAGDELTMMGSGRDGSIAATIVTVAGIYESGSRDLDRNLIEMPIGAFDSVFSMEGHGHALVIYHEEASKAEQLRDRVQKVVGTHNGLVTLTWDELQPGLRQMIELDYSSGWFMYAVLVAIIVFSIMNTFLMSVLERTREFGIMMALGYKAFSIGKLVMMEAFVLTLMALVLGTALGAAVNYYFYVYGLTLEGMEEIAAMYNMPATLTPQMSFKSIFTGPAFILIFTLLAALYPVLRIRKLEPVEAMRKI